LTVLVVENKVNSQSSMVSVGTDQGEGLQPQPMRHDNNGKQVPLTEGVLRAASIAAAKDAGLGGDGGGMDTVEKTGRRDSGGGVEKQK